MGGATAARLTFEPGWRWSECIKPVAGTDSCQVHHVGVVQSGRIAIKHDDGTEIEIGPGEAYVIEPGHDLDRRRRSVRRLRVRVSGRRGVRPRLTRSDVSAVTGETTCLKDRAPRRRAAASSR